MASQSPPPVSQAALPVFVVDDAAGAAPASPAASQPAHDYIGASFDASLRAALEALRPAAAAAASPSAGGGGAAAGPPRILFADDARKLSRWGRAQARTIVVAAAPAVMLLCNARAYAAPSRTIALAGDGAAHALWLVDDASAAGEGEDGAGVTLVVHLAEGDVELRLASAARRAQLVSALQAAAASDGSRVLPVRRRTSREVQADKPAPTMTTRLVALLSPGKSPPPIAGAGAGAVPLSPSSLSPSAPPQKTLRSESTPPAAASGVIFGSVVKARLAATALTHRLRMLVQQPKPEVAAANPLRLAAPTSSTASIRRMFGPPPPLADSSSSGGSSNSAKSSVPAVGAVAAPAGGSLPPLQPSPPSAAKASSVPSQPAALECAVPATSPSAPAPSTAVGGGSSGSGNSGTLDFSSAEALEASAARALSDAVAALQTIVAAAGGGAPALERLLAAQLQADASAQALAQARAQALAGALGEPAGVAAIRSALTRPLAATLLAGARAGAAWPAEAAVRAWGTRALWRLLSLLRGCSPSALQLRDEVSAAGGFAGCVLRGALPPPPGAPHLAAPVYAALVEVLIDTPAQAGGGAVSTFGRRLARPEQLGLLMRLLPAASWPLRRDALRDVLLLLVHRPDNVPRVTGQADWLAWLAPLLAGVPRVAASRTSDEAAVLTYTISLYTLLLARDFEVDGGGGDIEGTVGRLAAQLRLQCGWGTAAIGLTRGVLAALLHRLAQPGAAGAGAARWRGDFDGAAVAWRSLFKLARAVEDFIFFRPAASSDAAADGAAVEAGTLVSVYPAQRGLAGAPPPLAPAVPPPPSRAQPGLHFNVATGNADDLVLAQRMLALFEEAGLPGDAADPAACGGAAAAAAAAPGAPPTARGLVAHGNALAHAARQTVAFLESVDRTRQHKSSGVADLVLLEDLARFLQQRQAARRTSFLSRAPASRASLVRALRSSIDSQRARTSATAAAAAAAAAADAATAADGAAAGSEVGAAAAAHDDCSVPANDAPIAAVALSDVARSVLPEDSVPQSDAAAAAVAAVAASAARAAAPGQRMCARCMQPLLDDADSVSSGSGIWLHGACHRSDICADDDVPRCQACGDPVATGDGSDDGLVACGAAWHRNCFRCGTCGCALAEVPHYDSGGVPLCAADHAAASCVRCAGCGEAVAAGDEALHALGATYHPRHFACTRCAAPLLDGYYERDGAAYDEQCFGELFCAPCAACGARVLGEAAVVPSGASYHPRCLVCAVCAEPLGDTVHIAPDGALLCGPDWAARHAVSCARCGAVIAGGAVHAAGATWHAACYTCAVPGCGARLPAGGGAPAYDLAGAPACAQHWADEHADACARCTRGVADGAGIAFGGRAWHAARCFACELCGAALAAGDAIFPRGDPPAPSCQACATLVTGACAGCGAPLSDAVLDVLSRSYCGDAEATCLACAACAAPLTAPGALFQRAGMPACKAHAGAAVLPPEAAAAFAATVARCAAADAAVAAAALRRAAVAEGREALERNDDLVPTAAELQRAAQARA